jgi:N-acetylglucosaminyldiphosphoundecaprenol N-acetyl-beta-D-mannosaminyltransferase
VLGTPIDIVGIESAVARIAAWAAAGESRVVCACNVHAVVAATQQREVREALAAADLATPDGAPVAWLMRRLARQPGAAAQARVSGPDLMAAYFDHAAACGEPVYLYGSTDETLARLREQLRSRWPGLAVAGWRSPPFRTPSAEEDAADVAAINASGARTLWVGLGCPKQELWMRAHRGRVHAVMLGVGAAFDFLAGTRARAPRWMRENGLEWLHRLAGEPRRLGPRYLVTNTLFLAKAARQWLGR